MAPALRGQLELRTVRAAPKNRGATVSRAPGHGAPGEVAADITTQRLPFELLLVAKGARQIPWEAMQVG